MVLISLIMIPIYIRFMGIEAYGLIGLAGSLQAIFSLLDMGFSTTMNREMARLTAKPETVSETRNLVRSLEYIYWPLALLIGLTVWIIAPILADHWVQAEELSTVTIQQALLLIGLILIARWPFIYY